MPDYTGVAAIGGPGRVAGAGGPAFPAQRAGRSLSLFPEQGLLPPSAGEPAGGDAPRAGGPEQQPATRAFSDLSDAEKREVQHLRLRDAEVRRHEQAHIAAGGQYVRGRATFAYTRGPDGRQYATGGEVSLDVGAARTPEATIRKMQVIRRAALAPESPSPQDRRVAAQAAQTEARARQEIARAQNRGEARSDVQVPPGDTETRPDDTGRTPLPPPPRRSPRPSDIPAPVADNAARARRAPQVSRGGAPVPQSIVQMAASGVVAGPTRIDYRV